MLFRRFFVAPAQEYRPRGGWLPLFLLAASVFIVISSVAEVEWVPETPVMVGMGIVGFLLGLVLAKRPLSAWFAWFLITAYGLLLPLLSLGHLYPPLQILARGWEPTADYWRQNATFLFSRIGNWTRAVSVGASSQETIVFGLGLALLAWFLAAYVAWSAYRQERPLLGLTLIGIAVAVNAYFGNAQITWIAGFVSVSALVAAIFHYSFLEQFWTANGVDYSDEIRFDLLAYALATAVILMLIAAIIPAIRIRAVVDFFLRQPAISQAEETLENAFAGVRQPRREESVAGYGPGGTGIMPRAFLLGNAPELAETVVMQTAVSLLDTTDEAAQPIFGTHWRALSYEVYTGRGWALSDERLEFYHPQEPIEIAGLSAQTQYTQQINWLYDERIVRYSMGQPVSFDQEVITLWRDATDLVRVQGTGPSYQVVSQLTTAAPALLRETAVADVAENILTRYTQLPEDLSPRVADLAQQVAGDLANPYDQARALERFLRQYPYSLTVELPPDDIDPVEFFLFELQTGYCDYYASSMVVLARSLGLPARMATGYLAQPPDSNGVQHIRQLDAHSWAEIYFAGYGWVEFEPTAAFVTLHEPGAQNFASPEIEEPYPETEPIPLPEQEDVVQRPFPWGRLFTIITIVVLFRWLWQQQFWQGREDGVEWAYGRLQRNARRLGHDLAPSETPAEFAESFWFGLWQQGQNGRFAPLIYRLRPDIQRLSALFMRRRYSAKTTRKGELAAAQAWHRLQRPLWFLRIGKFTRIFRKEE